MNIAEWTANEILNRGMDYYHVALKALTDSTLRQTLGAELVDGALISQDVELGADVTVERGAVILGQTKILRGRVEQGAVVVDCVAQVLEAKSGSLIFLIEQLNARQVESEPGQLLTDIIMIDEGIVRKVRVALDMGAIPEEAVVLVNGKHRTVAELMRLADFEAGYLGGSSARYRQVLLDQPLSGLFERSGSVTRFEGNPILSPIRAHSWESKMVYNPAAIRLDGITYIVYRAFGDDHISRLGLAWSRDGMHLEGRLPHPIFVPQTDYELAEISVLQTRPREKGGCEDPRLVLIGERVYLTYSAYSDVLQIALASITKGDFCALPSTPAAEVMDKWTRHGPVFPGTLDRNAVLFPQKINGQYAMLRRPIRGQVRDTAISYSDTLETPWPADFEVVMKARPGMWDSERVGAGAQVLETRHGWLLIYHGVGLKRGRRCYMLGVALLALDDPSQVLYRSAEPVFVPEQDYELYGWAPNVVFTDGAVARARDAGQVIKDDDEIMIYYGGGDRVVGVAWAKLSDLVPSAGGVR
jgi:predicted GH43/DUF377 family glycosyl hydrolase